MFERTAEQQERVRRELLRDVGLAYQRADRIRSAAPAVTLPEALPAPLRPEAQS